jgi:excisionase family DNA binding protein
MRGSPLSIPKARIRMANSIRPTPDLLLTIPEVAGALRVSEKTIRRWISSEMMPAAKLGAQWRVRSRDLQDFVRDRLVR